MKYTSALVIAALLGASFVGDSQAVQLKTGYTDDLIKSLTEDMQKDAEKEEAEAAPEEKPAEKPEKKEEPKKEAKKSEKKDKKSADKKKDSKDKKKETKDKKDKKDDKKDKKKTDKKKEEVEEIPMDAAAIKAYSSVIADAAEDSEPSVPVQYHETIQEEPKQKADPFVGDPMASMIQNEISDIKDASIKAAKDKSEEWDTFNNSFVCLSRQGISPAQSLIKEKSWLKNN